MYNLVYAAYYAFQFLVLFYFASINLTYAVLNLLGVHAIVRSNQQLTEDQLDRLLTQNAFIPVSLLVAAYNEEKSIVSSVRSLLKLHYPVFEIIIASDGSTDETVPLMIDAFNMVELTTTYQMKIPCEPVHRVYRSRRYPNLTLIEKDNGGKADATNAAANIARYPLVCALDADTLIDARALLRIVQQFRLDPEVIAVGGTLRPINGATVHNGQITALNAPRNWLARMQVLEYKRAFFSGRAGWASLDALLIISGAFGVFRRDTILQVGGWATWTITEDIELVTRLHRYHRDRNLPYKIRFVPAPVCWTEVPSDITSLRRQRNRWHRGLLEVLWHYRGMIFNPRYGRVGLVALPYMLLVEAFSPVVELSGLLFLPFAYFTGILSPQVALLYLLLAYLLGLWLTLVALGIESLLYQRYNDLRDNLRLIAAAFLEMVGYRQILVVERFIAMFQVRAKRGSWGKMKRTGF